MSLEETSVVQLAQLLTQKLEMMNKRSLEIDKIINDNDTKLQDDEKKLMVEAKQLCTKEEEDLLRSLLKDSDSIPNLLRNNCFN